MSKKRWSEDHGYEVVRQWRRSGQSMAKFARAQGYNEQRVRYWREREAAARPSDVPAPRLLPGVLVNVGSPGGVSIALPRGVVVEARSAAELPAEWVAEVARALESSP
jgi:hypothetical protein